MSIHVFPRLAICLDGGPLYKIVDFKSAWQRNEDLIQ